MDISKVRASSLSDAMRKLHPHRHHVLDLVSPTPGRVLFGPAATLLFAPLRADVPKEAHDFEQHLRLCAGTTPLTGKVLVAAAPGAEQAAIVGGVRLALVEALGFSGVLTTARMRDFDEARTFSLEIWCRGETAMAGSAEAMPVAANVPLALDGATVMPGDYVYASDAGAIVIPARDVTRVLELAVKIEEDDTARMTKARAAR